MSRVLIVAGLADADFAEEVRRATRGLDIEIARSLPAGEQRAVLLVWSAAAPATAADVPTLIDLWSQGRLVIVRRDATALPLGLGDLDTVPPGAPARETAFKLLQAALAPGEGAEGVASAPPPPPPPPPAAARAPMVDPAPPPAAMARSTRRWPVIVAVVVVMLAVGGVASWLQMASLPPAAGSAGPDEAAMRRELEAARRMQELSEREQRSKSASEGRDMRAAAERAAAERAAAERAARDVSPPPPAPPPSVAPSSPPPPSATAQPTEDTRIVDLERQIAELKQRLEASPVDGGRAAAPGMPAWTPWAAAAGVVAVLVILLALMRRRRPVETMTVPVEGPAPIAAIPPPPITPGESLFVSYAHRDRLRVDPLVLEIEGMGRAVWIDRTGMTGGPGWAGQIARAIKGSRAVVLMASPSAYASDQVVRELYLAMGSKKIIVPIELEPADMPDELAYILAPFQRHALAGDPRTMLARALDKV